MYIAVESMTVCKCTMNMNRVHLCQDNKSLLFNFKARIVLVTRTCKPHIRDLINVGNITFLSVTQYMHVAHVFVSMVHGHYQRCHLYCNFHIANGQVVIALPGKLYKTDL